MRGATGITKMLTKKKFKPTLRISAHVSHHGDDLASPRSESKWLREDLVREQKQVKAYSRILKEWDPEAVAAKAKLDVETNLAEAKLRVKDLQARIKLRAKEGK